jgi:hypothetical protein
MDENLHPFDFHDLRQLVEFQRRVAFMGLAVKLATMLVPLQVLFDRLPFMYWTVFEV